MQFSCKKAELTEAVTNINRIVPSKSINRALEGIQIKAADGKIKLTGYDMEAGITTTLNANIIKEGEIVLSGRLFSDMLRKMGGEEVFIEVDEKFLTVIKNGFTEYTILGIPSDEFPELPSVTDGQAIKLSQQTLKNMIDQTLFAVATTDIKPVHTGSLFDIGENEISLVSVDGYRLAKCTSKIEEAAEMKFVVPGKVLGEISKMLKDDDDEKTEMTVSKRHIVFSIGNYSMVSRLLEGEFLDYKSSIPTNGTSEIIIDTRDFIESVERVSLLISDRLRSPLRIYFDTDKIKMSCSTSIGKSYDEISCQLKGESLEMGFNNKYLLDALKAVSSDKVRIEMSGALSPIKILPPEGEDYLFLVLPVRLKNEA